MNSPTKCWFVFAAWALVVVVGGVAAGQGCGQDETVDSGVEGECCAAPDVCKGKSELDRCVMIDGEGMGYCLPWDSTFMECVLGCAKPGSGCRFGCCYSTGNNDEFPCIPLGPDSGTRLPGETCSGVDDCDCGAVCLERNGEPSCWQVCTADYEICGIGACTDTGLGFSVCADEEPE